MISNQHNTPFGAIFLFWLVFFLIGCRSDEEDPVSDGVSPCPIIQKRVKNYYIENGQEIDLTCEFVQNSNMVALSYREVDKLVVNGSFHKHVNRALISVVWGSDFGHVDSVVIKNSEHGSSTFNVPLGGAENSAFHQEI